MVICDVLRHMKLNFLAKITQIVSDFFVFQVLKSGQICGFHWTSQCFSFRGFCPYPSHKGLYP